jgi:hypothetical protein
MGHSAKFLSSLTAELKVAILPILLLWSVPEGRGGLENENAYESGYENKNVKSMRFSYSFSDSNSFYLPPNDKVGFPQLTDHSNREFITAICVSRMR